MHRIVLPFLISFILLMIVIAVNQVTYGKEQKNSRLTEHSRNVIKLYDNLVIYLRSAESYSPEYENSAARNVYLIYKKDIGKIESNLLQLRDSINDNGAQVAIVDSISLLVKKVLPGLTKKNVSQIIDSGEEFLFSYLQQIYQLIQRGLFVEEKVLQERRKELTDSNQLNNKLTLLIAIFATAIITVTFFSQFFLSKRRIWLESFLESILNTTQNAIIHYKAIRVNGKVTDFKVEYANNAIQSLLGVEPKKVLGKTLTEIDAYSRKTELFAAYVKVIETGIPLQLEHLYHTDGVKKWINLSIAKMKDGITVAIHDISAVKSYEEQLKKNIAALEQSNTELEEYAYAASHDLQEPLRKIKTFGSVLQETQQHKLDEKGELQLEKILQSADRMSLLIKDLLSFSSLKTMERFEPTDLNEIFENVLQDVEVLIEQKNAIITHDALPEIDAIPVQMNQLFYNLVNNSLKFSKADLQLHLDVSCKLLPATDVMDVAGLDKSMQYYEIVFSDNGIGFSQDYAVQIFGLFKRLNDKSVYAGSGIGLALCKKVVVNHGGVITANGKEGIGAQFYIYLPQKQPKAVL